MINVNFSHQRVHAVAIVAVYGDVTCSCINYSCNCKILYVQKLFTETSTSWYVLPTCKYLPAMHGLIPSLYTRALIAFTYGCSVSETWAINFVFTCHINRSHHFVLHIHFGDQRLAVGRCSLYHLCSIIHEHSASNLMHMDIFTPLQKWTRARLIEKLYRE